MTSSNVQLSSESSKFMEKGEDNKRFLIPTTNSNKAAQALLRSLENHKMLKEVSHNMFSVDSFMLVLRLFKL